MEVSPMYKIQEKIVIKDNIVMDIYGEFNKTTGFFNLYFTPVKANEKLIKENMEEVNKQIEKFKEELNQLSIDNNFMYKL